MDIQFCSGWTFQKETFQKEISQKEISQKENFPKEEFQKELQPISIDLPHDAMIYEQRYKNCINGINSGYYPGGKYTYKKTFELEESNLNKNLTVHFEGVYQNCKVYLNDQLVGSHFYGYTPFDVDLTGKVLSGPNTLRVEVDNTLEPNCRWYSGSGIYRPVTLKIRDKNYIKNVHITTQSIDPAVIKVEAQSVMSTPINVCVFDGQKVVAQGPAGLITVPNAKLWSDKTPQLYKIVVSTETDQVSLSFGIRKLEWSARTGLAVNGQRVLLRGGCVHHDNGILGACEYATACERKIRILKENGFNAVRISHNPASQEILDACDRLGMYVINEAFDGWYIPKTYHDYSRHFATNWQEDVYSMVEASRNHPCVVMYSTGNEVSETATQKGVKTCEELTNYVHSLDNTRPVTAGVNVLLNVYSKMGMGVYKDKGDYKAEPLQQSKTYKEKKTGSAFFNAMTQKLGKLMFFMAAGKRGDKACLGAANALDIIGLNYASSRYDYDAAKYPDRMMVGSETLVADLPYNWERVKKYPQLVGDFVWAAWDYLGETCMGWTYHSYKGLPLLANQGMIDITGCETASMGFMQVVWGLRKKPYIAVRPLNHAKEKPSKGSWQFTDAISSWNWPGFEGTKAVVEVYSPGESLRLVLNNKLVGQKKLKAFKTIFSLPYEKGTLSAEALDKEGNVISRSTLASGRGKMRLSVKPEKKVLSLEKEDLAYVPIEFVDEQGLLLPFVEQPVTLKVSENITLLGFGSALYKTDETFLSTQHKTYRGRAMAVFKAGKTKGIGMVEVKSDGVDSVTIQLEVR